MTSRYRLPTFLIGALALLFAASAAVAQTKPQALLGDWEAQLRVSPTATNKLRLRFDMAAGKLTATLINLDKGNAKIPVSEVTITGAEVRLVLPSIRGSFPAELSTDGKVLDGYWMEGAHTAPLAFTRRVTE